MRTLAGAVTGLLFAVGLWIAIAGFRGITQRSTVRRSISWDQLWWRGGLVVAAAAAGWALTGWPAAGVLAGGAAAVAPLLSGTRRRRDELNAKSEPLLRRGRRCSATRSPLMQVPRGDRLDPLRGWRLHRYGRRCSCSPCGPSGNRSRRRCVGSLSKSPTLSPISSWLRW